MKTTQKYILRRINRLWNIHIIKYYLTIKRNEQLIHGKTSMSLLDIMMGKRLNTKFYILYDSCSSITGKSTVKMICDYLYVKWEEEIDWNEAKGNSLR